MKEFLKRPLAAALAAVLAFTMIPVQAADSPAIGKQLLEVVHPLQEGADLTRGSYWNDYYNGPREEMYLTYTPGESVAPLIYYGDSVTSKITGSTALKDLESQGYRVIAGVNGDFFDSNGVPTGVLISGGRLLSSDGTNYAVGFKADGTAAIGIPNISLTGGINGANGSYLAGFNKARNSYGGIYCYTYEFKSAHNTGTTDPGVEVVLEPISQYEATGSGDRTTPETANPVLNAPNYYKVLSVHESTGGAFSIKENQLVLSVNQAAAQWELNMLRSMVPGDVFTLNATTQNQDFVGVTEAIGALYPLVKDGQVCSGLDKTNAPRTAIGIRKNGQVIVYSIDGRQSGYSIGASQSVLAQRMAELGCVTAICLDGGGSTTSMITFPHETSGSVLNRPSDGSERKVTNHLFFVATEKATGSPSWVSVNLDGPVVLTGSTVPISGTVIDTNYYPMAGEVTFDADRGSTGDNTYTAPTSGTSDTIYGYYRGYDGSTAIKLLETPETLTIKNGTAAVTAISLEPGATVDLTAVSTFNRMEVLSSDDAYTWSVDEAVGTVDQKGVLTVGNVPTTGNLTVTKGAKTVKIPVTVTAKPLLTLEDFEDGVEGYSGYQLTVSEAPNAYVRFGGKAMQVDYSLEGGAAGLSLGFARKQGYDTLTFWVYGDNSGNTLSLYDENGLSVAVGTLDFSGWKAMTVTLPKEIGAISAMLISGQTMGGTLYFDQFIASYGGIVDNQAPVIEGTITDNLLTATVQDATEGVPTTDKLTMTVDGKAISFTISAAGVIQVDLTSYLQQGGIHRITLKAQDASGNLARKSWDFGTPSLENLPFTDLINQSGNAHWAASYLLYLNQQGIINGYDTDGVMTVKPDKAMTRAEFAVTLMKWMGIDEAQYADVTLPFADLDKIEAWVLPAAKAMYALGVMSGNGQTDGSVTFDPQATITRAQAITMLGRIQEKGYAAADLSAFPDSASVQSWAKPYLETMVAQGIIGGMDDGTLAPGKALTRGQACKILYLLW